MMRRRARSALAVVVLGVVAALVRPVASHARAVSMLKRFTAEDQSHFEIDVQPATRGRIEGRLYTPRGAPDAPAMVLIHGVHYLGIEEPRLKRFARSLAASGVRVFTPQVEELADYRIDPRSIETIGDAVKALRAGGAPVGLLGLSFAGGLALLAAADPRYRDDVAYVVAIGAHDDLPRVLRYFVTNETVRPDGSRFVLAAHEYGLLVLAYSRPEAFFAPEDRPEALLALRAHLREDRAEAAVHVAKLSEAGRARFQALIDRNISSLEPQLERAFSQDAAAFAAVSPHGHLGGLRAPVLLLHGAGDNVIPATETEWLAADVPAPLLRAELVSPVVQHVELSGDPSLVDKLQLVHWVAVLMDEASARR